MKLKAEISSTLVGLIVLIALFISSREAVAQEYFPVKPGAEWTYRYSDAYDPSGVAKTTVTISDAKVERNGEMYFEMMSRTSFSADSEPTVSNTYVRNADDGAIYGINPEIAEDEYLFFPASTEVGNVWTGLSGSSAVVETDATVQTPNGEFTSCVVIESIAGEVKAYSYYQEGKGLVAMKLGDQLMMYLK